MHKRFGRLEVLKGVSLEVRKGETVCIIGPSGSGKTTFIRCINHLEKVDAGRIEVNGRLIGYREQQREARGGLGTQASPGSGHRSGWSSSASTSSRTRPRSRT